MANQVPPPGIPVKQAQPASTIGQPTQAHGGGGEETFFKGHPSMRIIVPKLFWGLLFIIVGLVLYLKAAPLANDAGEQVGKLTWVGWKSLKFFVPLGLAGIGLLLALVQALGYWAWAVLIEYQITSQRVIITSGLFSRRETQVDLTVAFDHNIEKSFSQRLVGLGTMHVRASDKDTPDLYLHNLKNIKDIAERIRPYMGSPVIVGRGGM